MNRRRAALLGVFVLGLVARVRAETLAIVACAPGYPGSTSEAQPTLDAFAVAVANVSGLGRGALSAVYYESEAPGVERLGQPDAAFALVPLPFFLKHETALKLVASVQAVPQGGASTEVWSLVAGKGRVSGPAALDGWELVSLAGYAPSFVRGSALGAWGKVPASARVAASGAVLSALHKAALGEKVAVLLDGAQAAAVDSLPFAADLEVVTRSAPMPAVVFCAVSGRGGPLRERAIVKALLELEARPAGAAAVSALRLQGFEPVDQASLTRARKAYAAAP
jgi:hypothetical protein